MSFSLEKDMYDTVLKHLPPFFDLDVAYAYGTEIPLSYRIADIGFAPRVNRDVDSTQSRLLARLNLAEIWAIASLVDNGGVSECEFSSALGWSIPKTDKEQTILSLCEAGLLEWRQPKWLLPSDWLIQQMGPIIFVELKLSNWEEALTQARFYLGRANKACVVLDGDTSDAIGRAPFIEEGIGLFVAWPDHIEMLVAPRANSCTKAVFQYFHRLHAVRDLCRKRPRKWILASAAKGIH
jgi:hypothetical protein